MNGKKLNPILENPIWAGSSAGANFSRRIARATSQQRAARLSAAASPTAGLLEAGTRAPGCPPLVSFTASSEPPGLGVWSWTISRDAQSKRRRKRELEKPDSKCRLAKANAAQGSGVKW